MIRTLHLSLIGLMLVASVSVGAETQVLLPQTMDALRPEFLR